MTASDVGTKPNRERCVKRKRCHRPNCRDTGIARHEATHAIVTITDKNQQPKRMIFDRLFNQLSFLNKITKSFYPLQPRLRKKELARRSLEAVNKLIANKNYKKALKIVNTALQNNISSNQLLLKKAFLLAEKNQHKEAQKILLNLVELKNKPKLSSYAQNLLKISKRKQLDNTFKTIKTLRQQAEKYHWDAKDFPNAGQITHEHNIVRLVRNEAERARAAGLPKLSFDFINITLQAGYTSPWLVHDSAVSLSMMGHHKKAIKLLEDLSQTIKNPKIQTSIQKSLNSLSKAPKDQQKISLYMAKQARRIAKANHLEIKFIPKNSEINNKSNVEALILKEVQSVLQKNPTAALELADSILDYFPANQWALEKKGAALTSLHKYDKASQILTRLIHTGNQNLANKASQSFSELLTKKANLICEQQSPQEAITFFIKHHLHHNLTPTASPEIDKILKQFESNDNELLDFELEHQQLQLLFNTLLIDYLEAQLREQGRLDSTSSAQKPGTIRKTAPKAG